MPEGRALIGLALASGEPPVAFETFNRPSVENLADEALAYTTEKFIERFGTEPRTLDLLKAGLEDSAAPVVTILKQHHMPQETALQMAEAHGTLATTRRLAEVSDRYYGLISDHLPVRYNTDTNEAELSTGLPDFPYNGCPAAGKERWGIAPDPLFTRFSSWAGQLAVYAYYEHRT